MNKAPTKSWSVVVITMLLVVGAVYLDAPLERCCGIEIDEHGVSALITMFLGATAGGTANAAYKRLAAAKAAGVAPQAAIAATAKEVIGATPGASADDLGPLNDLIAAAGDREGANEPPPPGKEVR